jgi:hypothetical protein
MAKTKTKPGLAETLAAQKEPPAVQPVATEKPAPLASNANGRAPSRQNQKNISGWFDLPVKLTLDELRAKRQRDLGDTVTNQELLAEALNDLFKKYGFPEVAPSKDR